MLTKNTDAPLILLVEDDLSHVIAIQRSFQLAPENYRLEIAGTLQEAGDLLSRHQPALVLTDYRLPDGNGSDLASLAHEAWPIILMTSKGSEQIAVQVMKAGIQDYVVKSAETFAHIPETVNHALKAWTLILARKQAEEALRDYARRLIEMEEELRRKLATELHDEIGRDLTVLGMNFSIISNALAQNVTKNVAARLDDSSRLIETISRTTRNIMSGLRPPVLDDYGLLSALRWHAELFSSRTGIAVSIQADEPFPRLKTEVETALFRIYQEALMNTAKHAHAKTVTISLHLDNSRLLFTVGDDGTGSAPTPPSMRRMPGWGMSIMRERAELIGGSFSVDSAPGQGTSVMVEIPMEGV
ncbi:MAG: response regulator [Desulfuromonadales bacterium]|nr:response regulator [Desulfuromonadales bacterium]